VKAFFLLLLRLVADGPSLSSPSPVLQASSLTRSALSNPLASHNVKAGSIRIIGRRSLATAAAKKEYDLVVIGGGESNHPKGRKEVWGRAAQSDGSSPSTLFGWPGVHQDAPELTRVYSSEALRSSSRRKLERAPPPSSVPPDPFHHHVLSVLLTALFLFVLSATRTRRIRCCRQGFPAWPQGTFAPPPHSSQQD